LNTWSGLDPPDRSANRAATCASVLAAAGAAFEAGACASAAVHTNVIASTLACRSQLFIVFSNVMAASVPRRPAGSG